MCAGYKQKDGSVVGDATNVDLTEAVMRLGWSPPSEGRGYSKVKGWFDVLPLVIKMPGASPSLYSIPPSLIKEVRQLSYPE